MRIQKINQKLKEIRGLERRKKKGVILMQNQLEKIMKKQSLMEEKQNLSNSLSMAKNKIKNRRKRNAEFIYNLFEKQCMKQRDEYKNQLDDMRGQYKKFMKDFKKLKQKNVSLMIENQDLKCQNKKLKEKLSMLEQSILP